MITIVNQFFRKGTSWYKLTFVNNKDPDQLVHPRSLINIFTVHILLAIYCETTIQLCVDSDKNDLEEMLI